MKIDTHQHYWRYHAAEFAWISDAMPGLQRDCMPQDCANARHAAGVDAVVAVQARTHAAETDFLLQLADQHPEVVGVVGWADLAAPQLPDRLAQWCQHPAFKGLRHILQDEPDVAAWTHSPAVRQGMHTVQQRGLVFDVLVLAHQLPAVVDFCARLDGHWLVLDHVGKPALRSGAPSTAWHGHLRALAALPHAMCKLSGLVTETAWGPGTRLSPTDTHHILACFDQALDAFGPMRLMFGSDWPVCQLAAPYAAVHGLAERWARSRLSPQEQDAFWSGNAIRCYGLQMP